jgi:hypothetical protein
VVLERSAKASCRLVQDYRLAPVEQAYMSNIGEQQWRI